jgi:hypothetical protein
MDFEECKSRVNKPENIFWLWIELESNKNAAKFSGVSFIKWTMLT